jgi:hypothetical protein
MSCGGSWSAGLRHEGAPVEQDSDRRLAWTFEVFDLAEQIIKEKEAGVTARLAAVDRVANTTETASSMPEVAVARGRWQRLREVWWGALVVALMLGWSKPGLSEVRTGYLSHNQLLTFCTTPAYELACRSYIAGVVDASIAFQNVIPRRIICIPVGVTVTQLRDVAIHYLQAHPEEQDYSAGDEVSFAISQAFPCPPQ